MIFKKSNASSDFIMAMGKKVGNLKEPPGGSSKHGHDKKSAMTKPVKSGPVPPVAKKKPMTVQTKNPHPASPRRQLGAMGLAKTGNVK